MIDDDEETGFCECGAGLDTDDAELCSVCAAAPHHHDCSCDDCDAYWHEVSERFKVS